MTQVFRGKLGLGQGAYISASLARRIQPARNVLMSEWEVEAATSGRNTFERKQDGLACLGPIGS